MSAAPLVPDRMWQLVEPLLPAPVSNPRGGRPCLTDRACLTGIVFVLRSGIPWRMLPKELGCGSGMSCWRRLRDWQKAGLWDLIHFALLNWLSRENQIDWSRAVVDNYSVRAVFGGYSLDQIRQIGLNVAASKAPFDLRRMRYSVGHQDDGSELPRLNASLDVARRDSPATRDSWKAALSSGFFAG